MAMRFSRTDGQRVRDEHRGWAVQVGCDRCGSLLRSAGSVSEDRMLDAHRRFGCSDD